MRFQPEYPEQIGHEIGRRLGIAWSAATAQDKPGYLTNGPCVAEPMDGKHRVTWRVMTDKSDGSGDTAVLDVRSGDKILASKSITREDFSDPAAWKNFSLVFRTQGEKALEFRTYWTGKANLQVDWVTYEIAADRKGG